MALVTITHYEGMGDMRLARVIGFRPGDANAVEYAAEQWAEHIGTARHGDGYGYEDDYGDGLGRMSLDVHFEDDRALIYQSWSPYEPTGELTLVRTFDYGGNTYQVFRDANNINWTRDSNGRLTADESVEVEEYWLIELVSSDDLGRDLIRRARRDANADPEWTRRYGYWGNTVKVIE